MMSTNVGSSSQLPLRRRSMQRSSGIAIGNHLSVVVALMLVCACLLSPSGDLAGQGSFIVPHNSCWHSEADKAIERCTRELADTASKGDKKTAYLNRADAYYRKGDYDRAIADYDQAIRLDPNSAAYSYYRRGIAYEGKDDYERAIADYGEAIRLDPNRDDAYRNRGNLHWKLGNYDRAIADYDQAVRLDPHFGINYNNRGDAYYSTGDYDRAIADYGRAIFLRQDKPRAYSGRGLAHQGLGELTRAAADFRAALDLQLQDGNDWPHRIAREQLAAIEQSERQPRRVALVIGNSDYKHLGKLLNPNMADDANDVGDALATIGFEVIRGYDLDKKGMVDKLREFTQRIGEGDTALFYFSGHGADLGGNYYMPIDAPDPRESDREHMASSTLAEATVIASMKARAVGPKAEGAVILIIDACRDFPKLGKSIGFDGGLAAPNTSGIVALYAAGFGDIALEKLNESDNNRNSVFTRALLPILKRKGLRFVDIAVDVSRAVSELAKTAGRSQQPATYLEGNASSIVLNP